MGDFWIGLECFFCNTLLKWMHFNIMKLTFLVGDFVKELLPSIFSISPILPPKPLSTGTLWERVITLPLWLLLNRILGGGTLLGLPLLLGASPGPNSARSWIATSSWKPWNSISLIAFSTQVTADCAILESSLTPCIVPESSTLWMHWQAWMRDRLFLIDHSYKPRFF